MTKLLKATEVAKRLNISRRSAYNLISSGEIPAVKMGVNIVRVDEADLSAYIENRKNNDKSK